MHRSPEPAPIPTCEGRIVAGIGISLLKTSLGSDSTQGARFEEVIEARGFTRNNKDGRELIDV